MGGNTKSKEEKDKGGQIWVGQCDDIMTYLVNHNASVCAKQRKLAVDVHSHEATIVYI